MRELSQLLIVLCVAGCAEPTGTGAPESSQPAATSETAPPSSAGVTARARNSQDAIPAWVDQLASPPFPVRDILTARVPPAQNAAPEYVEALKLISGDFEGYPEGEKIAQAVSELSDIDKLLAQQVSDARIDQVLASVEPALQRIDRAQQKPLCDFETPFTIDAQLPHAQAARVVARIATLQLYVARKKGDFTRAERAVRQTLRLSRDLRRRGPFVSQLVSGAMDGVVMGGLSRLTLTDPGLTVQQCEVLLGLLREHVTAGPQRMQEALPVEYITLRNTIDSATSGRQSLSEIVEMLFTSEDSLPQVQLNNAEEMRACDSMFHLAATAFALPYSEYVRDGILETELQRMQESMRAALTRAATTGKLDAPYLTVLYTSTLLPARDAEARFQATEAGTLSLLMVRRHQLVHGRLPSTLAEAAADSPLKTVPTDPYNLQPMSFQVIAGTPTVYSVGKDLKDQGGAVDWKYGREPGDYLFPLLPVQH